MDIFKEDKKIISNTPGWARYVAQDPDGSWWAYEAEPHIHDNGWYENEIGRLKKIGDGDKNQNWKNSLQLSGIRST